MCSIFNYQQIQLISILNTNLKKLLNVVHFNNVVDIFIKIMSQNETNAKRIAKKNQITGKLKLEEITF